MGCPLPSVCRSSGWAIPQVRLPQTRAPTRSKQQSAAMDCRQPEERNMHSNFRKVLVATAMIGMAPSAFADVITDWNEKTVAFVTPRMVPAAGQRVVAIVQVAMIDSVN